MDEKDARVLRLADAMNTYNDALAIIRGKGYQIYFMPDTRSDDAGDFWAIEDRRDFIASDPLRLLGLITVWEHHGDGWYSQSVPDIWNGIMDVAFPDDEYMDLSDERFTSMVDHLRPFFDAQWKPLPTTISRAELAHIMDTYYRSEESQKKN